MRRLTAFIYLTTVSKRTSENLFHFSFRFIFFPFSKSLFGWKVERKRKRQLKHSLFPSPSAFLPLFNDSRNVVGWIRSSWRHLSTCDPTECLFDFSSLLVFWCSLLFRLFSLFICLFGVRVFSSFPAPCSSRDRRRTWHSVTRTNALSLLFSNSPAPLFPFLVTLTVEWPAKESQLFFFFFVFIHLEFPYRAAIPGRAIQSSDSKRVGKGRFNGSLGHELEVFALSLFLHQEFKEGENNNINLTKIVVNVSLPKPLVDAGIYFEYLILRIIVVILINLF